MILDTSTLTHYTLRFEKRPWTLNVERQGNRWRRSELVREWRDAFAWLARKERIPHLDQVAIGVTPELRNRASMPDTGACIGAAKAAIDGLVDAGVLSEDGPDIVTMLSFHRPEVTGTDALRLVILPLPLAAAS